MLQRLAFTVGIPKKDFRSGIDKMTRLSAACNDQTIIGTCHSSPAFSKAKSFYLSQLLVMEAAALL